METCDLAAFGCKTKHDQKYSFDVVNIGTGSVTKVQWEFSI